MEQYASSRLKAMFKVRSQTKSGYRIRGFLLLFRSQSWTCEWTCQPSWHSSLSARHSLDFLSSMHGLISFQLFMLCYAINYFYHCFVFSQFIPVRFPPSRDDDVANPRRDSLGSPWHSGSWGHSWLFQTGRQMDGKKEPRG